MNGRVGFVTGGASGIGKATAAQLAARGVRVMVADRDEEAGMQVVDGICATGGQAAFVHLEVTDPASAFSAVESTLRQFGKLDLAVNAAGVSGGQHAFTSYPHDIFATVMSVNVQGVFYCMQAEMDVMVKHGGGSIVNVASAAGLGGFPLHAAYSASKHAVIGLTRTAALEVAKAHVRVNAICPSFVDTPMVRSEVENDERRLKMVTNFQPIGRMGTPDEIACGIVWLLSEEASFVTGIAMPMDGGATA